MKEGTDRKDDKKTRTQQKSDRDMIRLLKDVRRELIGWVLMDWAKIRHRMMYSQPAKPFRPLPLKSSQDNNALLLVICSYRS